MKLFSSVDKHLLNTHKNLLIQILFMHVFISIPLYNMICLPGYDKILAMLFLSTDYLPSTRTLL